MKNKYCLNRINTPLLAFALATGAASAGSNETMTTAPAAPMSEDVVSGVLKLDMNTHFISYGNDVWQDKDPSLKLNFNPFLELAFALPAGFKATLGTWWDVNSKGNSGIGGELQEVDTWVGLAYTYDKFTIGVVGQDWIYGSATEEVLDVNLSYACFLSPTLTIHNRLGEGASGGDEGTVLVAGISYGFDAGPLKISIPLNVAYFATDEFHPGNASKVSPDTGFGYASLGLAASLPLGKTFGDWTLNGGVTYYLTNSDVIPTNPTNDFLTASLGLSLAF